MEIIPINADTWRIEDGHVRFFLLEGRERALLIDSGMTVPDVRAVAQGLTDKPLDLLNTHADPDHIGGNHQFQRPYMALAELPNYHNTQNHPGDITPLWDGDTLELGQRRLSIIALPGHTPGSIAVLDERDRTLFSGDPVQDGQIFMFGVQRDLTGYVHSLKRLQAMADRFDVLYPSHGTCPMEKAQIGRLICGAEALLRGEGSGVPTEFRGRTIHVCDVGCARFLCE